MNIVHVTTVAKDKGDQDNYGNIFAVKTVIAEALGMGRPGAVAANEAFKQDDEATIRYWMDALFGLDPDYITAYLKAHLRSYKTVTIQYIEAGETRAPVTFGARPKLTLEETLRLFRVVDNRLSPENLTADGERPRAAVRKLETALLRERALLVRLLGREPTWEELYPTAESAEIVFVTCPECGESQADLGRNVRCENCGYGPMPTEESTEP